MGGFWKRDVLAGLMFIALACGGFAASLELETGTSVVMGPGYFPRLLSGILLALGVAIAGVGLWSKTEAASEGFALRRIGLISLSGLAFAALLQRAGIIVAIAVTVAIGSLAGERPPLLRLGLLIAALIAAAIALFVWGIGIPLPIWPQWRS